MSLFAELLTQYMQRVGVSDSRLAWKLNLTRQTIFLGVLGILNGLIVKKLCYVQKCCV